MFELKSEPIVIRGDNNRWRATPPHEVFAVILAGLEDVPVFIKSPDIEVLVYEFLLTQDDCEYTVKFIWDRSWDRTLIQCYDHTNKLALGTSVAKNDILPTFESLLECIIEHKPLVDIKSLIPFDDTKNAILTLEQNRYHLTTHQDFTESQIQFHKQEMLPLFDHEKGKIEELSHELYEYETKCIKIKAQIREHEDYLTVLSDQLNKRIKGLNTMRKVYKDEATNLDILKKHIFHYGGLCQHKRIYPEENEQ